MTALKTEAIEKPETPPVTGLGIGTFRKNVMKTVLTKPVKLGLKTASGDRTRTTLAHSSASLKANTGRLLHALTPYILGMQFTPTMQEHSLNIMGDIAYDLTVLCRSLKVKMPTSTKKIKLVGTRTAGLLTLDAEATNLLGFANDSLFSAPHMKVVKKSIVLPNKGGAKEERDIQVVDKEAEVNSEKLRQESMKGVLASAVDVFWRLCFDIFKEPPQKVIDAKFARMQKDYPNTEFDLNVADEEETTEAEAPQQATA